MDLLRVLPLGKGNLAWLGQLRERGELKSILVQGLPGVTI